MINQQGAKGRTYSIALLFCKTVEHSRYAGSKAINQIRTSDNSAAKDALQSLGASSKPAI
jgi:hypothetical protein